MRTLIVDDSAIFRAALRTLLAPMPGLTVVAEADAAASAIAALTTAQPDLVLLDLSLGSDSGLTVLEAIKRLHRSVHVFVVTNHAEAQYRASCIAAGADRFFDKSSELDLLFAACARLAGPAQGHSSRVTSPVPSSQALP